MLSTLSRQGNANPHAVRQHFAPPRTETVKNKTTSDVLERMWKSGTHRALLAQVYEGSATEANSWAAPQSEAESPASPLLGLHPAELRAGTRMDICTLQFLTALLTIAEGGKRQTTE